MESALLGLAVLACPVGMGLMMWFMMKGQRGASDQPRATARTDAPAEPASVEVLREEQRRLEAQISRLESERSEQQPEVRG